MSNAQLLTTIAALIFTVYSAAWINQRAIERQIDAMRLEQAARLQAFESTIAAQMRVLTEKIDAGFARLGERVDRLERPIWPGGRG